MRTLVWLATLGCDDFAYVPDPPAASPEPCPVHTWFADDDRDGWGDRRESAAECVRPRGYVAQSGDCDDADALANPGAVEECDPVGRDEDCDGDASWYADDDGDAYGGAVVACTLGHATREAGDCDDADPGVHPAAAEICGDGVDQDCDGNAGRCGPDGVWDMDAREPAVPGVNAQGGDFDGDGREDLLVRHTSGDLAIHLGPFDAAPRGEEDAVLLVPPHDGPWIRGHGLADIDGDGTDELVAAQLDDGADSACVWIDATPKAGTFEPSSPSITLQPAFFTWLTMDGDGDGNDEIAVYAVTGPQTGTFWVETPPPGASDPRDVAFAWHRSAAAVGLGDVDGDGLDDVALPDVAGVWISHGPLAGEVAPDHVTSTPPDALDWVAAVGDLDGDGRRDLGVRTRGDVGRDPCIDPHGFCTFVDLAPFATDLLEGDAVIPTEERGLVAEAGDLDGDGQGELLLDAGPYARPNRTWIFTGPFSGVLFGDSALAELVWSSGDQTTATTAVAADLDGDGIDDLAASTRDGTYLLFGGAGL